jgi:demethylmenaquinone methyltransferase/2-methoxy-6-polyprenyl-1,4-benzoquinol methylase
MAKIFKLRIKDYIHDPKTKRVYNREMFTHIAPRYDLITQILSLCRDTAWKNNLVRALPPCEKPNCFDIASGTGDITFRLARKYPNAKILAIDISEVMIELARSKNKYENITFELKDMCDTGAGDNTFDIVTGGYALRNAPDLESALVELHRVMKPGATAAFLDFSKSPNRLLQTIELFFLKTWGGFWGLVFHRKTELYTYIAESLKLFPDRKKFRLLLEKNGFGEIQTKKHYLGILETTICKKA